MRYAARVKADPTKSLVYDQKAENDARFLAAGGTSADTGAPLTGRQKMVLGMFFLAFVVMIYGVIPWEDLGIGIPTLWWWFPEMTASFLFFAILIGVAGRMGEDELHSTFVDGARDLLGVALIIGIARGITVIMTNGLITDTVLNAAEQAVADLGGAAFITLMYVLFLPLSFLIPSSSGLATVAMPIMAPLASFASVPEFLVVTAYQTANGLINLITPTSAVVMGGLAIARVGYGTWLRFVWPMLVLLGILSVVVLDRRDVVAMTLATQRRKYPMTAQAPASAPAWHTLSVDDALKAQSVDPQVGLSAAEVEKRRAQYGPNKFAEAKKESGWSKFVRQYQDPMQIVLLVAALISLVAIEGGRSTAVLLFGLTLLNAVMSLSQEAKAEASVAALQKMMIVHAGPARRAARSDPRP